MAISASMPKAVAHGIEGLEALKDQVVGPSDWHLVTQEKINEFAEVTGDDQWIHIDVERAKQSPFGGDDRAWLLHAVAGAALLLRLVKFDGFAFRRQLRAQCVRFPAPVPTGSRRCACAPSCLSFVDNIPGGQPQITSELHLRARRRRQARVRRRQRRPRARRRVNAFVTAGAGFLLAVLWFDLMFDVQTLGHGSGGLPEPVLDSIRRYYARVTTGARPMNRLIATVMLATLAAIVAEIVNGEPSPSIAYASLALAAFAIVLAGARTVPSAVRLGSRPRQRRGPERSGESDSAPARAVLRVDHRRADAPARQQLNASAPR